MSDTSSHPLHSPKRHLVRFEAVVVPDGRIGMVINTGQAPDFKRCMVQFGASGPFSWFTASRLRCATAEEVKTTELEGIGGLVVREIP